MAAGHAGIAEAGPSMQYVAEEFTPDEQAVLRPYVTNLDRPVFALVNLPEVVKGALFARYSRSPKSLRRLFLDEFVGDLDLTGDLTVDASVGLTRAEELYDRVFLEYGDDSVAQLGGVHLACEQASNVLTKILEWGRLMAYLEQSTRYIPYTARLAGRYRYHRPPDILESALGLRFIADLDAAFDDYAACLPVLGDWAKERYPKESGDSDFVYKQSLKAKACDAARGILPAATLSNVGIYGTGQAFEALLLRMRSHPLPEAGAYAAMMLEELRKVIPSFLTRVDRPERGGAWSAYLAETRADTAALVERILEDEVPEPRPSVMLTDFDPEGEDKVLAAICYPQSTLPDDQLLSRVRRLGADERHALLAAYVGDRENRRHKPGRAFERTDYRFDVLADYGAFRDLQRHRMLTIEWQPLTPWHGYETPEAIADAGLTDRFDAAMERAATLYEDLERFVPDEAAYAVALAYRVRFVMQFNAREAMHLLELRSSPQGHPAYRQVAQEMHRLIAEQAGHPAIAAAMRHVDHQTYDLERLGSERAAEVRRAARR
ncbi:MAG TPA: FAD-dependent thymidylate synthase [Acidimicrobiia bacterium]|nr:FAD-dependent thymidylate synthase [Acidimicrobiia bacterium]